MKIAPLAWLCAAGALAFCSVFACGDNKPTNPGMGGSSSSGSTGMSGSGGNSGSGSGSGLSSGGASADGGTAPDAPTCPSGLQDNVTTCSGSEPTCVKGCGPDMVGGVNNNLGSKTCSCNAATMVYHCQSCIYPQPLPSCYAAGTMPAACPAGVASKGACATACNGVCTTMSDAGKVQGCVCVANSAGSTQYTCATQWW